MVSEYYMIKSTTTTVQGFLPRFSDTFECPRSVCKAHHSFGLCRLRYKGYFGGVTAMTKEQFYRVNGFSNTYWGWGGEDDDLRIR